MNHQLQYDNQIPKSQNILNLITQILYKADYFLKDNEKVCFIENDAIKEGIYISSFKHLGNGAIYFEKHTKCFKLFNDSFLSLRILNLKTSLIRDKYYSLIELYKMCFQVGDKWSSFELIVNYETKEVDFVRSLDRYYGGVKSKYRHKSTYILPDDKHSWSYDIDNNSGELIRWHDFEFVVFAEVDSYFEEKIKKLFKPFMKAMADKYFDNKSAETQHTILNNLRKDYRKTYMPNLQNNIIMDILTKGDGRGITFDKA